jgi:integrase/recombinase XerC
MFRYEFIKYLKYERRFSEHTVRAYQKDLDQFFDFLSKSEYHGDFTNTKELERLIRFWLISLIESKISERTINRKFSSLKSYFRYLLQQGKISKNPVSNIYLPKISRKLPNFVDQDHMNLLLDENIFANNFNGLRDRLIIEMLYQTGIRLAELINIEDRDIDLDKKQIKIFGKRKKERIVPITNELIHLISSYKKMRELRFSIARIESFFVTNKGKKLYEKFVYRVVKKYLGMVTTMDKKSPHVLRHTFATHMLNRGAELNAIKELLGHANLSATQVYTHNTFEKLKEIYQQAHPRN